MDERGLRWSVGIPRNQKVYGLDVTLIQPTGRKRRPRPDQEPQTAEAVLAKLMWRRVTWRHGTQGPLAARFAAVRVRVGDGATWASWAAQQTNRHLPGEEAWLVGEWRSSGERKYYLSNLPLRTSRRSLAAAIKARWVCEQGHQQLKQELGLGHFEGRSWAGLHRHALMTCIAFAYLQHLRLAEPGAARSGKNVTPRSLTATIAQPAPLATRHHPATVRAPRRLSPMSPLQAQVSAEATSYSAQVVLMWAIVALTLWQRWMIQPGSDHPKPWVLTSG